MILIAQFILSKLLLQSLSVCGRVLSIRWIEPIHVICLVVQRLLLHVQFDLLVNLNWVGIVLRVAHDRLHLVVRVLVHQLLLYLMRAWIVLVLVLAECKSTLPYRWVLQLRFGCHESNWPLLLRDVVLCHELLRVDHGKKTVQCLDLNFLRISHRILILQIRLRAQLAHVACWLPVQVALLEGMEHFLLRVVERVGILLLIVGRYAVHQCFEGEPIFPLQLELTFPFKFISRLMTLSLLLRQALWLKLHETMDRLVVAPWRLPLWKLILRNCARCRGIGQDNVLILHLAQLIIYYCLYLFYVAVNKI